MPITARSTSTTSRWAWAGAATGLLLCLLLFAPARWIAQALSSLSDGHVELVDARGTIWNGTAELVLTGGVGSRDAMRLPQGLKWQLRPVWGALQLKVKAPCCTGHSLELRLSPAWPGITLQLAAGQSTWPARLLSGLGAPWNTLELDGRLSLNHPALLLRLTDQGVNLEQGTLTLEASNMGTPLSTLRPLGSYRLQVQGGAQNQLQLETLSGGLRLEGRGHWSGARLRFDGIASAAPAHEAELANLLNIIGRRDGAHSIITLAL